MSFNSGGHPHHYSNAPPQQNGYPIYQGQYGQQVPQQQSQQYGQYASNLNSYQAQQQQQQQQQQNHGYPQYHQQHVQAQQHFQQQYAPSPNAQHYQQPHNHNINHQAQNGGFDTYNNQNRYDVNGQQQWQMASASPNYQMRQPQLAATARSPSIPSMPSPQSPAFSSGMMMMQTMQQQPQHQQQPRPRNVPPSPQYSTSSIAVGTQPSHMSHASSEGLEGFNSPNAALQRPSPSPRLPSHPSMPRPMMSNNSSYPRPSASPSLAPPAHRPPNSPSVHHMPMKQNYTASPQMTHNDPQYRSQQFMPKPTPQPPKPIPKPAPVVKSAEEIYAETISYDKLLMSLADEYIEAAHKLAPQAAGIVDGNEGSLETYHNLISAGLSCLEAALKNFKLAPRVEAALTLRLVSIMFDETENYDDMEALLSKGITICESNRLNDIKYSMYYLLAQITFQRNQKVALKSLDTAIQEVEASKNSPWIYALKFLRASLSLQAKSSHELTIAIQNLRSVAKLAERREDRAIFVAAVAFEAFTHILTETADSLLGAQEAIAKARSFQMHPAAAKIPQIWTMLNCVDLICSLVQFKAPEAMEKMKIVQTAMDSQVVDQKTWSSNALISIPLGPNSSGMIPQYPNQLFTKEGQNSAFLNLNWMNGVDAYATGFLLCGITSLIKNPTDPKADTYIQEGIKFLEDFMNMNSSRAAQIFTQPKSHVDHQLLQTVTIYWYHRLYQTVLQCIRLDWASARSNVTFLKDEISSTNLRRNEPLSRWLKYLQAIIEQGEGNLDAAKELFTSIIQKSPSKSSANRRPGLMTDDLSLLSQINLLQVLQLAGDGSEVEPLLEKIKSQKPDSHPDPAIRCAYALISATIGSAGSIPHRKSALQQALTMSRSNNNLQMLAITMSTMVGMFFTDIVVGEQAKKSRTTAQVLATKAGLPLWVALTKGLALQAENEIELRNQLVLQMDGAFDDCPEKVRQRFSFEQSMNM